MKLIVKNLSHSKFKRFCIIIVLLLLYIFISAVSYTKAVCLDISKNVFRLHVIANSNSNEDQNLKYLVRDNIISYINDISKNANSKDEVTKLAQNHINEIESIALNTVRSNGFDYSVKVDIGNFTFPSKRYGDITLPPGYYDALKVQIGEAKRSKLVVCNVSSSMFCGCNFGSSTGYIKRSNAGKPFSRRI